jgi:hypothetical protein
VTFISPHRSSESILMMGQFNMALIFMIYFTVYSLPIRVTASVWSTECHWGVDLQLFSSWSKLLLAIFESINAMCLWLYTIYTFSFLCISLLSFTNSCVKRKPIFLIPKQKLLQWLNTVFFRVHILDWLFVNLSKATITWRIKLVTLFS